ncbi:MAG: hypothetical protein DWH78_03190 [Planctomycetota bacterium]|nr:MAG: hypothetical protein DWH78_03190 [Planctomycetota bacterium]
MTWRHTLSHPDGVSCESSFRACQIDYVFRQDSHPPTANLTPWGPQKRPAAFLALARHNSESRKFAFSKVQMSNLAEMRTTQLRSAGADL